MTLLHNKGFSLIELIIVIAIIGILAAIGIPQFSKYRKIAHNSKALSDLKNAVISQEAYYAEHRVYAGSLERLIITHNFVKSNGVEIIINGNESAYEISSHHPNGDRTYMYTGPGGTILAN